MREVGIRSLLLKGPSIAAWLYSDGAARPYADSDLLVAPGSYSEASDVLRKLGFYPREYSWHRDSETWLRPRDAGYVDLHRSLIGVEASPDSVWKELTTDTAVVSVWNIEAEVLRVPARAFHIALHAAQHGVDHLQPIDDLARALHVVDQRDWHEAADLARRLDALPAFAAGLRLDPKGVRLAQRLNLPANASPDVALRAASDITITIALERLAREGSLRARARLLLRALAPSRFYMRHWSGLHMTRWPAALRRGSLGLGVAYLWRPIWILIRLPKAIAGLHRARQRQADEEQNL